MRHISLEALQEKEHRLLDDVHDDTHGLDELTSVDRFMELNNARMGEDSEELALREKRTRNVLWCRPLPSYQSF